MHDIKRIGEILVDLGVLTIVEVQQVLAALRARPGQVKFGQMARDMGLVREEHILAALAVQLELFPNIRGMSLDRLLGRLADPIRTPVQLPVKAVRQRLKQDRRSLFADNGRENKLVT
jgi:hypothetical protein